MNYIKGYSEKNDPRNCQKLTDLKNIGVEKVYKSVRREC